MDVKNSFYLSKYEQVSKIGVGQFGEVYKVKEIETGTIYAAKISLSFLEDDDERDPDEILNHVREVNIMSKLNHPSIVKFIGYSPIDFYNDPRPVIITEYMTRGSLTHYIDLERNSISDPNWNITKKLINLYGIASAMSYLHKNNIIHRDLKPDNILMDDDLYPKISDFGFSKILHSNQSSMSFASQVGFKGTVAYSPPEILTDEDCQFSKAGDVYAFGMIAFEIMTAKYPFKNTNYTNFCRKIINGERPQLDDSISDSYQSLIQRCWSQEPKDRPTFDEIVDELKNDTGFITDLVEEAKYLKYVDYIDECQISFSKGRKILSFEEFLKNKQKLKEEKEIQKNQQNEIKEKEIQNNQQNEIKEEEIQNSQQNKIKEAEFKNSEQNKIKEEEIQINPNKIKEEEFNLNQHNEKQQKIDEKNFSNILDSNNNDSQKSEINNDTFKILEIEEKSKIHESEDISTFLQKSGVFSTFKFDDDEPQTAESEEAFTLLERSGVFKTIKIEENEEPEPIKIVENDDEDPDELFQNWDKFYNGKGVPVIMEEAAFYCKKAADKGHVDAMYQYATMLQKGEGVEVNKSESAAYLVRAANFGHAELAYCIGLLFKTGDCVTQNKAEAARYFKIAADKGHILGIKDYAIMNVDGDGIPINIPEARKYLKIGADQGIALMMEAYANLQCLDEEFGIPCDKKEAAKYYKMAADLGLEKSMFYYGKMCCLGDGIPSDKNEALKYTKMSADKGFPFAMYIYGIMVTDYDGIPVNKEEGLKYLKMAADNDITDAMYKYAYLKLFEEGYEHNEEEAVKYFKMSAEKGHVNGMFTYGKILSIESIYMDKKESFKYIKMAADQGHAKAMFNYGSMLLEGDGIEPNIKEGVKYIKMAADKGLIESIALYGKIRYYGREDIEADKTEGIKYLKIAAENEHPFSMLLYGSIIDKESPEESIKYIKAAADKGLIYAMYLYGTFSLYGSNVPKNSEEAAKYLKVAADNEHLESMYIYGLMLNEGEGVEVDKVQSALYLKKAADLGHPNSSFQYGFKLYSGGDGIPVDKKEASVYIKRAADNGHVKAMAFYGCMLSFGDGIQADEEGANLYIKMATDQGFEIEEIEKLRTLIQLQKTMSLFNLDDNPACFEVEGIRFSEKKEGVNLKKFKLYEDRFVISESKNSKIVKTYNTGEYNIVEAKANFGMDISTSVDLLHKTESIRLKLQTKEDKEKLLQEFEKVIKKAHKEIDLQVYAPINVPSNLIQRCMICFSKFSFMSAKYHCSMCGTCVCKKCFQHSIALVDEEPKKVCDPCFNSITKFKKENKNPSNEQVANFIRKIQSDAIENQNNPRFYKKI